MSLFFLLLSVPRRRTAEIDGGLDEDINPHLDDHPFDSDLAHHSIQPIERFAMLPSGWFTHVVGYSDEVVELARMHAVHPATRFTLLPEGGNPHGALAFSTFAFQHPRTRQWRHAVLMLSLTPGMRGEVLGEAHFPPGVEHARMWEAWARLNRDARWDRRSLLRKFGFFALRF